MDSILCVAWEEHVQNRQYSARIAGLSRYGRTEQADALRRELREQRLREHIEQVVDTAPPLTAEQRARLAALLIGDAA